MERKATKDQYERESEEVERLVRPAPKLKPPRHDKRRESVDPDKDPDLNTKDKDLSKNYKDIGGSVGARVVTRWAKGLFAPKDEPKSKVKPPPKNKLPKAPQPAGKGATPPASPEKNKVRYKETGKVVMVSDETLKESPGAYEKIDEKETAKPEETAAPQKPVDTEEKSKAKKTKAPEKPSEAPKDSEPKSTPVKAPEKTPEPPSSEEDASRKAQINALAKQDPKFASFLKSLMDPNGTVYQMAKGKSEFSNPKYPIANLLQGYALPEGVTTVGDFFRVMETPDSAPVVPPSTEKQPSKGKSKGKGKGKSPPAPKPAPVYKELPPAPGTPTRKVTKQERDRASNLISNYLPPDAAAKILAMNPPIHPDEVNDLIRDFNTAKEIDVSDKDLPQFAEKAAKFFASTPSEVKTTPKTSPVPFEKLPEDLQVKLMRKHQIKTVAMSMAASHAISSNLERNTGAPKELAETLGKFMLGTASKTPEERMSQATKEAEELFSKKVDLASYEFHPVSKTAIRKILSSSKDPAFRALAVGYFQAQDYQDARKLFLDPDSPSHISEHQSPKEIARGLAKASDFLQRKSDNYPEDVRGQNVELRFRSRIMKQLSKLRPDSAKEVGHLLDEQDNKRYDQQLKSYWKDTQKYEKALKKVQDQWEREQTEGNQPKDTPEERLYAAGIDRPREPQKPPHYDLTRKTPDEQKQSAESAWGDFESRAARIAARYQRSAFSTYRDTFAMGNRKAVYWGVDPTRGSEKYPGWEQPQARDLGDSDMSSLLKSARKWLGTPVLASNIDGIVRDTQLRAALDLAIRSEGYESALHPSLYNDLLARLAGVPEDETLLTVTASNTRNTMSNKVELETAQADKILKRLDKMAATIEAKHEEWGMPFKLAKSIVNEIDKTADELEKATYGADSMLRRQASVLGVKTAEVLQRDSDESYMDTFKAPMRPHQTDGDEPYMQAYADDQSSAVDHGKSTTGRPLVK